MELIDMEKLEEENLEIRSDLFNEINKDSKPKIIEGEYNVRIQVIIELLLLA
jgi:hypothetical protein